MVGSREAVHHSCKVGQGVTLASQIQAALIGHGHHYQLGNVGRMIGGCLGYFHIILLVEVLDFILRFLAMA